MKYILSILILFLPTTINSGGLMSVQEFQTNFLADHMRCEICGSYDDTIVHEVKPVYLYPELAFDEKNLVVLCESGRLGFDCHNIVGHGAEKRYINPWVKYDIEEIREILNGNTENLGVYLQWIVIKVQWYNVECPIM